MELYGPASQVSTPPFRGCSICVDLKSAVWVKGSSRFDGGVDGHSSVVAMTSQRGRRNEFVLLFLSFPEKVSKSNNHKDSSMVGINR